MKFTLPKGKYYIGDPCYVFSHDTKSWEELLELTNYFDGELYEFKGYPIFAYSTAWGDGVYVDNYDRAYGVDAGLIGIVDVRLIEINKDDCKKLFSRDGIGHIFTFKNEFEIETDEKGWFRFDNIEINTKDDPLGEY
jgi:hypothetical protein